MKKLSELQVSNFLKTAKLDVLRQTAQALNIPSGFNMKANTTQTRNAIVAYCQAHPNDQLPSTGPWNAKKTTAKKTPVKKAPVKKTTTTPAQTRSNSPWPWIIGGLLALALCVLLSGIAFLFLRNLPIASPVVLPVAPTATPQSLSVSSSYPLNGQEYESPQGSSYNAIWTADGRLWQPRLPTGAERIAHSLAFTIEEGQYAFDGVECQLFVDTSRNGAGASNPVTVKYGNDLRFSVSTADHGQAWALVQCRGNASSGFQIRWLGH
jgi:hypothetical protein